MYTEILARFCERLGVLPGDTTDAEAPDTYHLVVALSPDALSGISAQDLADLTHGFGDALSLVVGVPSAPPLVEIRNGNPCQDSELMLRNARRWAGSGLWLDVSIDKEKLIDQCELDRATYFGLLFLFRENFLRLLKKPLTTLDSVLFESGTKPTVVFISNSSSSYVGPFLRIVGLGSMAQPGPVPSPKAEMTLEERVVKYRAAAADSLSWSDFSLAHITPSHFLCQRGGAVDATLEEILCTHLWELCVLFTANRSSYSGGCWQSTYASSDRTAHVVIGDQRVEIPDRDTLLPRFAVWPYAGSDTDRLTMLQNVIARELETQDPKQNARQLANGLRHLLGEAQWHYRVFLDGKIDKHFEGAQKVEDYVAQAAKSVSESVDAITKGLADTLLATIGYLVLTFLASAMKGDLTPQVFSISAYIYASYVLLIQGVYRVGSIVHSYTLLDHESSERLKRYSQILGKERVQSLAQSLEGRRKQFKWWTIATVILFLALVIVVVWLGAVSPPYLNTLSSTASRPIPTIVPTSVP